MLKRVKGSSATELGLLAGLISILIIGSVSFVGTRTDNLFATISNHVNNISNGREFPNITAPSNLSLIQYETFTGAFSIRDIPEGATISVSSSNEAVLSSGSISVGSVAAPTISFNVGNAPIGQTVITLTATFDGRSYSDNFSVSVSYADSCRALSDNGLTVSGTYIVDPDGAAGGIFPLSVYCDMNNSTLAAEGLPAAGWTVFSHNRESKSADDICDAQDCKIMDVTYYDQDSNVLGASVLSQFVSNSATISQRFRKDCTHSIVTEEYNGGYANTAVAVIPVGGSVKVSLSTAKHYDGVDPDCQVNDTTPRVSDKVLIGHYDILPMGSLWGGDSEGGAEISQYTIGKLYLR